MAPEARPEQVIMVVVTDGRENSSQQFRGSQIRQMITEKSEKHQWQFVYLSADINAVDEAERAGFSPAASMSYDPNKEGIRASMRTLSKNMIAYRQHRRAFISFSDEDRASQKSEQKRQKKQAKPSDKPQGDV